MAQLDNDKCQADSTFQAHVSHESEWHVAVIRHVSIHMWRQQVYITLKLSISGFYIASKNSTITMSRTPKCRKGPLWVSKNQREKCRNPVNRPSQWVMWTVQSLQRFFEHEFCNVRLTMTWKGKTSKSRNVKPWSNMNHWSKGDFGPLIWLPFGVSDTGRWGG